MNEDLTKDWVCRVWEQLNFQKQLLVWDAYKCQLMSSVRREVTRGTNTDLGIIPGSLTSALQPAHLSWNKPFKAAYCELYDNWMVNGDKNYTRGSNVCTLSKITCLQWVAKAWESVTEDVICKSFKACGISVKTNGSEDAEIHCLKSGCIAEDAACEIGQLTATLEAESSGDEDPCGDLYKDDDELETNEVVIDEDEN